MVASCKYVHVVVGGCHPEVGVEEAEEEAAAEETEKTRSSQH